MNGAWIAKITATPRRLVCILPRDTAALRPGTEFLHHPREPAKLLLPEPARRIGRSASTVAVAHRTKGIPAQAFRLADSGQVKQWWASQYRRPFRITKPGSSQSWQPPPRVRFTYRVMAAARSYDFRIRRTSLRVAGVFGRLGCCSSCSSWRRFCTAGESVGGPVGRWLRGMTPVSSIVA